jgi:hypothetical protein
VIVRQGSYAERGLLASAARMTYFVLLTLVLGYCAAKVVPAVAASFRFAQVMQDEVLHGPVNEPASTIHRRLIGEASRLGIEVAPDAIVVDKRGATLNISARYLARVELLGMDIDWPIDQRYEGTRRPPATSRQGR